MLKWIKNSKGGDTNKSTNRKGITIEDGMFKAVLSMKTKRGKRKTYFIGKYKTLKEAEKARINYILNLL